MADAAHSWNLHWTPYASADASQLGGQLGLQPAYLPVAIARTAVTSVIQVNTTLAANDDIAILRCRFTDPLDSVAWLCTRLMLHIYAPILSDRATFDALFHPECAYTAVPVDDDENRRFCRVNMNVAAATLDGDASLNAEWVKTVECPLAQHPALSQESATEPVANDVLAAICVQIETWDAAVASAAYFWLDAQFLGFPLSALTAASMQWPYLHTTPGSRGFSVN